MTNKYPIPTQFPVPHPAGGGVTIVGDDGIGLIAESTDHPGFRYYLTDCCLASAKGSMVGDEPAVVCRACYHVVDDALGGIPADRPVVDPPLPSCPVCLDDGQPCDSADHPVVSQ